MTFGELLGLVRREIIVDEYEDAFTDDEILTVLWRASSEIAAAFDFPRRIVTQAVADGAVAVPVPSLCRRVHSVSINGDDLRPADMPELLRMQSGTVRPARYFNYDPRRIDALRIAPRSPAGTATVEFTSGLSLPVDVAAAEVWDGVLPEFHALVAYRAGVVLFQMDEREGESAHLVSEYQLRSGELAAFLGRTDVGNLMLERQLRNDEGAAG